MTSGIVSLLAQRPEAELQEMLDKARNEASRLFVEIEQIEEALARQARRGSRPTKRGSKGAGTRKRILEIVGDAEEPMSPSEIIGGLREQGSAPTNGAVHNMIRRMLDAGELAKVADGQYQLASRSRIRPDAFTGPERNGSG